MNIIRTIFVCLLLGGISVKGNSQNDPSQPTEPDATSYRINLTGTAATGEYTPFWLVSNQYGVTPLESGNGFLQAGVFHSQNLSSSFRWNAGVDMVVAAPRRKNVFIQQLYAEIGFKSLLLSVGSKERYTSIFDRSLSSGDMILSTNARPIPEVNLSMPEFNNIPFTGGWTQIKGEFAVGRSFDTDYLDDFIKSPQLYTQDVLWHHKSVHVRIKDTKNGSPLFGILGVRHVAQWGGESNDPRIGKQPQSLEDFVRVVFGKAGGEGASKSDSINVLGAHHISYDFLLGYTHDLGEARVYHQHLSSDKSGLLFQNGLDGLWGLQLDINNSTWIKKIVFEYLITRNQSGSFHFIEFDHDKYPGRGGGGDDYYNNIEYTTGNSYFNRSIGSPLITSPEYNEEGILGFSNNRVQDWHIGLEGEITQQLSYRALFTIMNGWGRPYRPFLKKKTGTSLLIDLTYTHPQLPGWDFNGSIANDSGTILGDNGFGFRLGVRKSGILKSW